jgi:hypothetical protein
VLDAATQKTVIAATMQFYVGSNGGNPVFDVRQTILAAELDGMPIDPALMAAYDLGGDPWASVRVLAADLPACSEHTLVLTYDVALPQSPNAKGIAWEGQTTRVKWDFWFSDLYPGRYLESWFPANLIHDRFPFTLEVELQNSLFGHRVVTNGVAWDLAANHWQVVFPAHYTALSPMFVLVADDRVVTSSTVLALPDDTLLTVDMVRDLDVNISFPEILGIVDPAFDEFIASTGAYAHGDRFTVYLWNDPSRSMEYDGATTSTLPGLDHEVFHSWYGRGVKPASQNDGWIDEGWDMFSVTIGYNETPLDFNAPPVTLASTNPWNRITPDAAYDVGEGVFAGLAAIVGTPALVLAMQSFYEQHVLERVTTADLERHLHCTLAEPQVRVVFHRFVYGQFGAPLPPPGDYCN